MLAAASGYLGVFALWLHAGFEPRCRVRQTDGKGVCNVMWKRYVCQLLTVPGLQVKFWAPSLCFVPKRGKKMEGFFLVAIEPPSAHPAACPPRPPLAFTIDRSFKKPNKLHLCNLVKSDLLHSPSACKTLHAPHDIHMKALFKNSSYFPPPPPPAPTFHTVFATNKKLYWTAIVNKLLVKLELADTLLSYIPSSWFYNTRS